MAIMDLVRDVTAATQTLPRGVTDVTIRCSDCGQAGAPMTAPMTAPITAPMTWAYARSGDRVWHTCPDCIRVSLDEIETHIRH